ncbi:kinase [Sphingomonas canadensis]|uniref:Kinase n=1 Tax=Sphingomonas canadensis TaxID=1219257 RepID=A0ABW3HGG5_9SPHN|nr:kinase [Sphingomonas canadensis]MCW3838322.1 kinase [Sphingomonas canadensis]
MEQAQELAAVLDGRMPLNASGAEAACLLARRIAALPRGPGPLILGINGAQGSGKSTLTHATVAALARFHGLRAALLSLDDFYRTRAERGELARAIHPLCATRGVPGTHDMALMEAVLASLAAGGVTAIPVFDKLADDRAPRADWVTFEGVPDVVLVEGWCVGIRAADLPAWSGPINALEAEADPDGRWFGWSRAALPHGYEPLWDRFALLVSIEVPDLETVIDSRLRQEDGLAAGTARARMDRAAVTRFVQHYERYTRALWPAMRQRADILFARDRDFGFTLVKE